MERLWILPLEATPDSEKDESTLVEAACSDPSAFDPLYERYLTPIYRYVLVRLCNAEDAADLTQQVFLQALAALPGYQSRGAPFGAWLFRIARNAVIDFHRRRKETVTWDHVADSHEAVGTDDPECRALRREALARVEALLAGLDADKRELLILRFVARLTAREIALVVGKSEAAVKKQLSRTLQTLKEQYRD